jgi:hypothetical protein
LFFFVLYCFNLLAATHVFFSLHFFNNRFRQTTVGALLALAAKEELGADVCAINGAPVKGNRAYADGVITFRQLKQVVKHHTVITATIMIYFVLNDIKIIGRPF